MGSISGVYRPRRPEKTPFYQCLKDYWEEFRKSYEYFYEKLYGPLRPVVEKTVGRFLECGIYRHGFARVRCPDCQVEFLLAFSCKTRYFCPSCQAKRVAAFVEWITGEVLEEAAHRQYVFTIPKALRGLFRKDRRLLGALSRCAWKTLQEFYQAPWPGSPVRGGAVCAIQTYGDSLNWHPHLHALIPDGVWTVEGNFLSLSYLDTPLLTRLFQNRVLEMLVSERRLSAEFADRLRSWRHSGFQVYRGPAVAPGDPAALERLAAYILRPSFASTRLNYDAATGQVCYRTAKGVERSMDALDWIALVTSHIPDPGEQVIRYYGRYSNASRGKRKKLDPLRLSASAPELTDGESEAFRKACRRSWARLLQKIYEVDPLRCPGCSGIMKIVAAVEQAPVIRRILQHLKWWDLPQRSPPPPLFPHKLEAFLATLPGYHGTTRHSLPDSIFRDDLPTFCDP